MPVHVRRNWMKALCIFVQETRRVGNTENFDTISKEKIIIISRVCEKFREKVTL